ncbi:LytR/AlgR family response regulator transcription factor [Paraflavitalea pollutisoli]|uniref:LytR/AlgR family response regulator transcription factor n=1 Tax=Paraflavitalea pollutisoli TaxID=3034143 RepID=UPI0023EC0C6D|nr:LytTR family DNA-binding domain-containing protein [Paraflavitalea sp. H1-2-19X]
MLKAFVIDDEPIAIEVVKALAAKVPFVELTHSFTNAFDAVEPLRQQRPDLLFLDIKMPDISGIDFLRSLPDPPMVIMTTAYSEHAVQSFDLDVIDFLLKPFSQVRFLKACSKAMEQHELRSRAGHKGAPAHLFVKSGYEQVKILLDELLYVESNANYVRFVLTDRVLLSRLTMADATELLPAFVRIHRSFLVAPAHITKIDKNNVWIGNTELPVGPGYSQAVEKILGKR